jgi:hypothetical protein
MACTKRKLKFKRKTSKLTTALKVIFKMPTKKMSITVCTSRIEERDTLYSTISLKMWKSTLGLKEAQQSKTHPI